MESLHPVQLYPMLLSPACKEVLWGGGRIASFKGLCHESRMQGESWELSTLEQFPSVIANGIYEGRTLGQVVTLLGSDLLGSRAVSETDPPHHLPLLLKMIDAREDLSIQVHPTPGCATLTQGEHYKGKSELWYVLEATPEAKIYSGFRHAVTQQEYCEAIEKGTFETLLASQSVRKGDVFYIPSGQVHAIGKGCLIFEVQQAEDLTYRIYDYGRLTPEGHPRSLHIQEAWQALDLTLSVSESIPYLIQKNGFTPLAQTPFFEVSLLKIDQAWHAHPQSVCGAYFVAEGMVRVFGKDIPSFEAHRGSTFLIPAGLPANDWHIQPESQALLVFSSLPSSPPKSS